MKYMWCVWAVLMVVMSTACSDDPPDGLEVVGTIDGKPYRALSGYAFREAAGVYSLAFTDRPEACKDALENKLAKGTTLVRLDKVTAADPAKADLTTYVRIGECVTTDPLGESNLEREQAAQTGSVSITQVYDDRIDGKLDITFDDNSQVTGSFSLPLCEKAITLTNATTCR